MKGSRFYIWMVITAVLFFLFLFISQLFFSMAQHKENNQNYEKSKKLYYLSHRFMPINSDAAYEYGFLLLKQGFETKEDSAVNKSISWLQRSIKNNIFNYNAHYYLGKAYLLLKNPKNNVFDQAVAELKRASMLKVNKRTIALDTARILLSKWSLNNKAEREFCLQLLKSSISSFTKNDFSQIFEFWWLYQKDINFLLEVVAENPRIFGLGADLLRQAGASLKARWLFLARYEKFLLQNSQERYAKLDPAAGGRRSILERIFHDLNKVKGYFSFVDNFDFQTNNFYEFKNKVHKELIFSYLEEPGSVLENSDQELLNTYIKNYIPMTSSREQLSDLRDYLNEKYYFKNNNALQPLYLKFLLMYKLGEYSRLTRELEDWRFSTPYMKSEEIDNYSRILLLQADAYRMFNTLSLAEATLLDLIELTPENLEIYWKLFFIHQILNQKENSPAQIKKMIKEGTKKLKNSRFIVLNSTAYRTTVYLFKKRTIEIKFSDKIRSELVSKKLFQLFVDNKIVFERYLDGSESVLTYKVDTKNPFSKHMLLIRII